VTTFGFDAPRPITHFSFTTLNHETGRKYQTYKVSYQAYVDEKQSGVYTLKTFVVVKSKKLINGRITEQLQESKVVPPLKVLKVIVETSGESFASKASLAKFYIPLDYTGQLTGSARVTSASEESTAQTLAEQTAATVAVNTNANAVPVSNSNSDSTSSSSCGPLCILGITFGALLAIAAASIAVAVIVIAIKHQARKRVNRDSDMQAHGQYTMLGTDTRVEVHATL